MVISVLKAHRKGVILALIFAFAFLGNALMNTTQTSAAPYPTIFKKQPSWRAKFHGYFYNKKDTWGDDVIKNGFQTSFPSYTRLGAANGGGVIVSDTTASMRFSDEVRGHLYSGNAQNSSGAAFIIFTMLDKQPSDAGSDPIGAAKGFFDDWKTLVDGYFDSNRVAYVEYWGSSSGIYNTLWDGNNPGDVAWYINSDTGKNFNSFLFLDSEGGSIVDATYAIRVDCGNPLGDGTGGDCICPDGEETCCECDPELECPPPDIEEGDCPLPDSAYKTTFGGTQAESAVTNLTQGGNWVHTDGLTSTAAFVWAKPGDSVRFRHTLCYGAQNVRGSTDGGGLGDSPPGAVKPSISNTATITALTSPATSGGKYLFGNTLNGGSTQTFGVSVGSSSVTSGPSPDTQEAYWARYYSPGNNTGEVYSCHAAGRGFKQFITDGYQIPDFHATAIPPDCNSSRKANTASDAGKTIEQNLTWNNVKSWQNTHNTGSGGVCNCDTRDAWASNTTHSYEEMKNGTVTPGTRVRNCYQSSTTGCGWCSRSPSYSTKDYKYFPINTTSTAGAMQRAQVKIPFNYDTTASVSTTNTDKIYDGGEYDVTATITIDQRSNPEVSNQGPYATISKKTNYEVVLFTVDPEQPFSAIRTEDKKNDLFGPNDSACKYYIYGAMRCETLLREDNQTLNPEGSLEGSSKNVFDGLVGVPDAEIGTKFCVAVAVWPSDSHDKDSSKPDGAGGGVGVDGVALKDGQGRYWNYSQPTCRTITKKPTVQFRSAGIFTDGNITTSITKKAVGYNFGDYASSNFRNNEQNMKQQSSGVRGGSRTGFGSFTEYESIAKGAITSFASGAAFGYELNNSGNLTTTVEKPGGYKGLTYMSASEPNVCTLSTQTINNDNCEGKVAGAASIGSLGQTILDRLEARYRDSSVGAQPSNIVNFNSGYTLLNNGAKYIRIEGDATIASSFCMSKLTNVDDSNTIVLDVSGVLTISGDIKYGGGSLCSNESYTRIAEIPQMLIFAKQVNITSNVQRIDSWLIVGQDNAADNGIINTCSDLQLYAKDTHSSIQQIGKDSELTIKEGVRGLVCGDPLTINGPVYAKRLILNRNYGAGVGGASIEPAEIFNLRPDTYLWAFNQASRFSQAVTTYQRELAPRY